MPSKHLILCCHILLLPSVFPASGSFPMSWLFASGGQRIGGSGSASVLPMNIQGWFPLGLTGLISLQSKGLSRVFSSTTVQKHQLKKRASVLWLLAFFMVQLSYPYMTTGKTIAFFGKVMSLLFNTLSRFVTAFLPRSKHLLISQLQSLSTVILEPEKIKSVTVFTFPHLLASIVFFIQFKIVLVLRMKCDFELKPEHVVYCLRLDLLFYLASSHTALEREGGWGLIIARQGYKSSSPVHLHCHLRKGGDALHHCWVEVGVLAPF